ncbi:TAXI family TRAP transporter solute-binding subunit [Pseudomonas lopnurensis]|uniref:TAXI family TRAP transporter solute-binding subunit n=1 Tax=Pseudomonas lopnurensis TaxID=1477517 RepID=UPI0028B1BD6A|nr:TAXI family TRAP transporter solute-binding subunit [Pseudomonas lopnurensis]
MSNRAGVLGLSMALSLGAVSSAGATEYRSIATATTTGAFYPIGGVMASLLNKMEGYNFTAEATGGSVENARLIAAGDSHIGFFGGDTIWEAAHGTGPFEGRPPIDLAPIANIFGMPLHFVALENSGIKSLGDFQGKTIAVGAPGSGTGSKAQAVLEAAGYEYGKSVTARYLSFREGADALVDGNADVVVISVGMPSGNIQEIGATHDIHLANIEEGMRTELVKKVPYFEKFTIPAGTYPTIDYDVETLSVSTYLAVDRNMSESEVYEICKTLFKDRFKEFKRSHASLANIPLEDYPKSIVPLHPGAERFYREMGLIE